MWQSRLPDSASAMLKPKPISYKKRFILYRPLFILYRPLFILYRPLFILYRPLFLLYRPLFILYILKPKPISYKKRTRTECVLLHRENTENIFRTRQELCLGHVEAEAQRTHSIAREHIL